MYSNVAFEYPPGETILLTIYFFCYPYSLVFKFLNYYQSVALSYFPGHHWEIASTGLPPCVRHYSCLILRSLPVGWWVSQFPNPCYHLWCWTTLGIVSSSLLRSRNQDGIGCAKGSLGEMLVMGKRKEKISRGRGGLRPWVYYVVISCLWTRHSISLQVVVLSKHLWAGEGNPYLKRNLFL